jgi:hypothetical protein
MNVRQLPGDLPCTAIQVREGESRCTGAFFEGVTVLSSVHGLSLEQTDQVRGITGVRRSLAHGLHARMKNASML